MASARPVGGDAEAPARHGAAVGGAEVCDPAYGGQDGLPAEPENASASRGHHQEPAPGHRPWYTGVVPSRSARDAVSDWAMTMWILGVAFLVVGTPFIWIASRVFARDRAIGRWPRADGVMTSARLETSTHRYTDKNTGLHSYDTLYTPAVRYTYTVGGQTFEGK